MIRKRCLRLAALLFGAGATLILTARADSEVGGKKSVRIVLEDQVAAWNRGDLKGFMAGYWQSPDLSFISGKDRTRGWKETFERYRKRYQAEGKEMGKLTFADLEIELVGADGAWARGRWQVETKAGKHAGWFTLIFRKTPDGWKIVHDHTSGE